MSRDARERMGAGAAATRSRRLPRRSLVELTDVLSVLMDSGLMLREALELAGGIFRERGLVLLVGRLLCHVERGGSFHSALDALPRSFPPVYRSLIRIGERTGSIACVLQRLGIHLKREARIRERLITALLYPAMVLIVAIGAVITTLLLVLPRLEAILRIAGGGSLGDAGAPLASVRPSLVSLGAVFLVAALSILGVLLSRRIPGTAALFDPLLLRVPILGETMLRWQLHRFSFAMMTLTSGGAVVEEALAESASVVTSSTLRVQILNAASLARAGNRLSDAFARQPALGGRMARWVAVGERTGSVGRIFEQLAAYLDREIERDTERFVAVMEPATIIVVGSMIIYLLFTFVLPIFSLLGTML